MSAPPTPPVCRCARGSSRYCSKVPKWEEEVEEEVEEDEEKEEVEGPLANRASFSLVTSLGFAGKLLEPETNRIELATLVAKRAHPPIYLINRPTDHHPLDGCAAT